MCDYKKIVIAGVINYAIIFLVVSLLMFSVKLDSMLTNVVTWMVDAVVVYMLATKYYFRSRPKKPFNEGLMFGLGLIVVGAVIEVPVMVYGFAADQGWAWFANWLMWVGYAITIATAVFAAKTWKK